MDVFCVIDRGTILHTVCATAVVATAKIPRSNATGMGSSFVESPPSWRRVPRNRALLRERLRAALIRPFQRELDEPRGADDGCDLSKGARALYVC